MERRVWIYWNFAPSYHKCDGDKTFFYGYSRPSSDKSSKLKELAERFGTKPNQRGLRGEGETGTGSEYNYLEESRQQFDKTILTAGEIGIQYNELLDLDIRKFNSYVDGYIKRRETRINDDLLVGHLIAGKISQAVWGSKSFKKPIKEVKLLEEKDEVVASNEKVFKTLKAKGLI